MDRRSPPLPFTAITRVGSPVSGSGSSNFELVLPPPKFVMRKSAPSRLDRYRKRSSGRSCSAAASRSSQRFCRNFVSIVAVSGTTELHVLLEAAVLRIPTVRRRRLESFDGERSFDHLARLSQRRHRTGRQHLHGDVTERGRLRRPGHDW